ncbi:hypothetical protein [Oceanobacillus alkalisoli]|uniref:hypothetical protein n=1 Tax=Oceanobacillus alkalisoli TaxID=2925113 RepID=UPI001F119A7B|nr:hypothetical protein [Oceanobacillus alkalisoli]MCF3944120.1 hypothetical protein [Oceanobacillus alkalisoli]
MFMLFRSKKKENIRRIESELFVLVERKERKDQEMDEHGRSIVLALQEYLQGDRSGGKYKSLMKQAKRYIKMNQDFF